MRQDSRGVASVEPFVAREAVLASGAKQEVAPASEAASDRGTLTQPGRSEVDASHPMTPAQARHLLLRATFGPSPEAFTQALRVSAGDWLEQQLTPRPEPEWSRVLAPYASVLTTPYQLLLRFPDDAKAKRTHQTDLLGAEFRVSSRGSLQARHRLLDAKEVLARHQMVEITRHVMSRYQLKEVMVDFWTNHFSVFAQKGMTNILLVDYMENVLRPLALGRFRDLLVGTARHPAMLIYLDQAKSRKGRLNENYARELLELHTLGVDAGYSQRDVREAARILTGYQITPPELGPPDTLFAAQHHDRGKKRVLGRTFGPTPAGQTGEAEAVSFLEFLAFHPLTASFLAEKLCARFVAEEPPRGCVELLSRRFLETGGDMAELLRALFSSPEFWQRAGDENLLRAPLEYVVGVARSLELEPDGTTDLARRLTELGQPLFLQVAPTGYSYHSEAWLSPHFLAQRFRFAQLVSRAEGSGLRPDWATREVPPESLVEQLFPGAQGPQLELGALLASAEVELLSREDRLAVLLTCPEYQRK